MCENLPAFTGETDVAELLMETRDLVAVTRESNQLLADMLDTLGDVHGLLERLVDLQGADD